MPRGPRLDAPGVLHHIMVRGIEGRRIFRGDPDRDDFLRRLEHLVLATGLRVYAWVLLPNHAHLLVRTGQRPLARVMRSLLTGYAGAFNRRHRRRGHLFQNRYKSIVVEEEPYFLELVRYLHLNPLRSKVVATFHELAKYRYCGHSALIGRHECPWQATETVLAQFGSKVRQARARYQAFVAAGILLGRRPELQGGGLVRSAGGWSAVHDLRRGREGFSSDERILGSSDFVDALRQEVEALQRRPRKAMSLEGIIQAVSRSVSVEPDALQGSGRAPVVCRAREGIAYLWIDVFGQSGRKLAGVLGIRPPSVYRAAQRGRQNAARWTRLLAEKNKVT